MLFSMKQDKEPQINIGFRFGNKARRDGTKPKEYHNKTNKWLLTYFIALLTQPRDFPKTSYNRNQRREVQTGLGRLVREE